MSRAYVTLTHWSYRSYGGEQQRVLQSKVKVWLTTTPIVATVLADVAAHMDPLPISGVIYLAALPYVDAEMVAQIATPRVLGYLDALSKTDDALVVGRAKVDFTESLFLNPEKVPYNEKVSWLGQSMLQPVNVFLHILSRPQDPAKLYELGQKGLPLLLMNGALDNQVQGDRVAEVMRPHFKDMEIKTFVNGSHASFYDCQDEFVESLLGFVSRIAVSTLFYVIDWQS